MENCVGYEINITNGTVLIALLFPEGTAKHQPLDLGIIANTKVR